MTREEAQVNCDWLIMIILSSDWLQRLREEEMAAQAQGKDCFIIPQANLDRFLPDGVTVSAVHMYSPSEPDNNNQFVSSVSRSASTLLRDINNSRDI